MDKISRETLVWTI